MLYLIGGAPRTGKSQLTRELIARTGLPAIPTDAVHYALTHAEPALGWDNAQPIPAAAAEFAAAQRALARNLSESEGGGILEGQTVLPRHARELGDEGVEIRACFLGWSSVDPAAVIEHGGENDWFEDLDDDERDAAVTEILEFSELVREQAAEYGFRYLDMADGAYHAQRRLALAELLA